MVEAINPVYTKTKKISKQEVDYVEKWLKEQPDIKQGIEICWDIKNQDFLERIDPLDKQDDRFKYAADIENTMMLLTRQTRKQIRITFVVDDFAKQLEDLLEIFSFPVEIKCDFLFSYSK